MMRTITGLFDSMEDAQAAAKELIDRGVPRDQISLVARDGDDGRAHEHAVGERANAEGAGVGGLAGGLIGAGVPEEHAHSYAEGVRRGGVLLAARADSDFTGTADEVMRRYGVADIERRSAEWRVDEEWRPSDDDYSLPRSDRDPSQSTRPDPAAPRVLRDHREERAGEAWQDSSKMGTAAGAMTGAATGAVIGAVGGPAGAVIGGAVGAAVGAGAGAAGDVAGERAIPADEYRSVNDYDQDTLSPRELAAQAHPGDVAQHEQDFRDHHQITRPDGEAYERHLPAYRFGYAMAADQRYQQGGWELFELQLRSDWERDRPGSWDEFRPAARFGWEKARGLR